MAINFRKILEGLRLVPKTASTVSEQGDMDVISSTGKLNYHNGITASPVVTESHSATLSNKTLTSPVINTPTADTITGIAGGALTVQSASNQNLSLQAQGSGTVQLESITVDANTVTGGASTLTVQSASNQNLSLQAQGSGTVALESITVDTNTITGGASTLIVQSASNQNLSLQAQGSGTVALESLTVDAASITGPSGSPVSISSTNNQNIVLSPNGTGVVDIDAINIADNTITTDTGDLNLSANSGSKVVVATAGNANIELTPNGTGVVDIDNLSLSDNTITTQSGALNLSAVSNSNVSLDVSGTGQLRAEDPLHIAEQATPSTGPTVSSGYGAWYSGNDGYPYFKNSSGAVTQLGAGSGNSNYIANFNASSNTDGWATYSDSAANTPTDGTGGTATGLTFTRSTSSPLNPVASFLLTQANSTNIQGKGVSYDFTIDSADQAKVLNVSFNYNASSTFVASNGTTAPLNDGTTTTNAGNSDIEVFLYDVTNAVLLPVSPQVITANGSNNFVFKGTFQTSPNSTSYRLILHVATASANATGWQFKFDNVVVNSQVQLLGPPILDFDSTRTFTPNNFGTISNSSIWSRRVGDSLEVQGSFQAGTAAGATASITLPIGVDATKLTSQTNIAVVGYYDRALNAGENLTATNATGVVFFDGSDTSKLYFAGATSSSAFVKLNANSIATSPDKVSFRFTVPIAGWSSTTTMSNDTDTRIVTAYVSGNPAATTADNPVIFPTATYDTHGAYNASTGRYTAPVSGYYQVHGFVSGTAGGSYYIAVNGTNRTFAGNTSFNGVGSYIATVKVNAGDLIDLRPNFSTDLDGNSNMYIERVTGPAAIAASESVNARYYSTSTSLTASTYTTISWTSKDFDSHSAMSSGTYTIPISGKYKINSGISITGTYSLNNETRVAIYKNGTKVSEGYSIAGGAINLQGASVSDLINCTAGDLITVKAYSDGALPGFEVSTTRNFISISKVGN